MMELTYQLTAKDFEEGFRAYRMRNAGARWFRRLFLAVAVLIFAICLAALVFFHNEDTISSAASGLGVSIVWLAIFFLQPKWAAKKQFQGNPSAHGPIYLRVTEEGIEKKGETSEGKSQWSSYIHWVELDTSFVLFSSPVLFYVYPKRAFTPEQASEFRSLLQRHVKN